MRRFEEALSGWTESRLTQEEAARMLGVCARSFRRYVDRYHEDGIDGLIDKRMSQASSLRAPVDEVVRLETLYKESYDGWSVAHFHERYRERHGGGRSYTWTKNRLQAAGLVSKGRSKGKHRKRRERAPVAGLLPHQDGSTHRWVEDGTWDLIATLDDATSEVYSGFFVDEEDTWSSLRGVRETVEGRGLFGSLWTDRGSHYWHTPKAGGAVDKSNPTQFGRAMGELGIEMIPSYSPQARGRSERHFGTMQGRLPNELAAEGDKPRGYLSAICPWANQKAGVAEDRARNLQDRTGHAVGTHDNRQVRTGTRAYDAAGNDVRSSGLVDMWWRNLENRSLLNAKHFDAIANCRFFETAGKAKDGMEYVEYHHPNFTRTGWCPEQAERPRQTAPSRPDNPQSVPAWKAVMNADENEPDLTVTWDLRDEPRQPAKPRQARDHMHCLIEGDGCYGALAIDSNKGSLHGWAVDFATQAGADQRALDECKERGGTCSVVMRFKNACAAYVADQQTSSTAYGWAWHVEGRTIVESMAKGECVKRGGLRSQCVTRVWGCASR